MKKIIASLVLAFVAVCVSSQNHVTQFLGIPVDGSKSAMIQKLKAKGFRASSYDKDILEGKFNGVDVQLFIATNNDKVCRVMLCDENHVDERSIQIRFNNLCHQFEKNPKYLSLGTELIPDKEDISYEIGVKNKRYEAVFYQRSDADSTLLREELTPKILEKYTPDELANLTKNELMQMGFEYMAELRSKRPVWFMISELYGKYYITMFYDNEYNRANGEDL